MKAEGFIVKTRQGDVGPLTEEEVHQMAASGHLTADDLVRRAEGKRWHRADTVRGLHLRNKGAKANGNDSMAALIPAPGDVQPERRSNRFWLVVAGGASSLATGIIVWAVMFLSIDKHPAPRAAQNTTAPPALSGASSASSSSASHDERDRATDWQLLVDAQEAQQKREYTRAEDLYSQLHKRDPNSAAHLVGLGLARSGRSNIDGAIEAFHQAIQIDRNDATAWAGLGDVLLRKRELALAVRAWERAAELAPSRTDYSMRLVIIYGTAGMWDRALPAAERMANEYRRYASTELNRPLKISTLSLLAQAYVGVNRESDAEHVYQEVLDLDPKDEDALLGLGRLAITRGETDKAKELFGRIEGTNAHASFELARIAIADGNLDEAARMLRRSLDIDGSPPDRWFLLAAVEHDRDRMTGALGAVDEAISRDSKSAKYRVFRTRVLLRLDRHSEALEECQRAGSSGAEEWEGLELRGLALQGLGRNSEAESALRRALEINATVQSAIALTDLLEKRKAWLESAEVYKVLERIDAGDAETWRGMRAGMHRLEAIARHDRGDLDGAIAQLRLAVDASPSQENKAMLVNALSLKALELMGEDNFSAARTLVQEIARFDRQEATELDEMIAERERLQHRRATPSPRVDPPVTNGAVESIITSDFTGKVFDHGNLFELQNGQIWKQTEYYIYYHYAYSPSVIIYQDGVVWKMKVEDIDHAVTVERVR